MGVNLKSNIETTSNKQVLTDAEEMALITLIREFRELGIVVRGWEVRKIVYAFAKEQGRDADIANWSEDAASIEWFREFLQRRKEPTPPKRQSDDKLVLESTSRKSYT